MNFNSHFFVLNGIRCQPTPFLDKETESQSSKVIDVRLHKKPYNFEVKTNNIIQVLNVHLYIICCIVSECPAKLHIQMK